MIHAVIKIIDENIILHKSSESHEMTVHEPMLMLHIHCAFGRVFYREWKITASSHVR